jgi:DNA-binding MarR family transcriptional regulator
MESAEGRHGDASDALAAGDAGDALAAGDAGDALAAGVAAVLERLIGLFRSLSPAGGLSLTAAATLATLERSGPCRLTALAAREGVTQPAMTQLIARLQDAGLVDRAADPDDGRVVQVRITADGRAVLAGRRAVRAERLAARLAGLSPHERDALAAALPAMDALANARRADRATTGQTPQAEPVTTGQTPQAEPVTTGQTRRAEPTTTGH